MPRGEPDKGQAACERKQGEGTVEFHLDSFELKQVPATANNGGGWHCAQRTKGK